jgi:hypothetical protein
VTPIPLRHSDPLRNAGPAAVGAETRQPARTALVGTVASEPLYFANGAYTYAWKTQSA